MANPPAQFFWHLSTIYQCIFLRSKLWRHRVQEYTEVARPRYYNSVSCKSTFLCEPDTPTWTRLTARPIRHDCTCNTMVHPDVSVTLHDSHWMSQFTNKKKGRIQDFLTSPITSPQFIRLFWSKQNEFVTWRTEFWSSKLWICIFFILINVPCIFYYFVE